MTPGVIDAIRSAGSGWSIVRFPVRPVDGQLTLTIRDAHRRRLRAEGFHPALIARPFIGSYPAESDRCLADPAACTRSIGRHVTLRTRRTVVSEACKPS